MDNKKPSTADPSGAVSHLLSQAPGDGDVGFVQGRTWDCCTAAPAADPDRIRPGREIIQRMFDTVEFVFTSFL